MRSVTIRPTIHAMAEADDVELEARFTVTDDHLSGEVRRADGWRRAFSGWLGLIGAIESARSDPSPEREVDSAAPSGDHGNR